MPNKEAILAAVAAALDGMGMDGGEMDEYGEGEEVGPNEVPIWSKLDVSVNDEGRGPIHSKESIFKKLMAQQPRTVDAYGMPAAGDQEEMMMATGLV